MPIASRPAAVAVVFYPYSSSFSAGMVPAHSPIQSIVDLKEKSFAQPAIRSTKVGCCSRRWPAVLGSTSKVSLTLPMARRRCIRGKRYRVRPLAGQAGLI